MRAILQRVSRAHVKVDGETTGQIQKGWLMFLGVAAQDSESDLNYIIEKTLNARAFPDGEGKMNLSVLDISGEVLIVSQFTLLGDCRKGRRPSFTDAAPIGLAKELYERCIALMGTQSGLKIASGQFQAHMQVSLENDGPLTLLLDSKKGF